MSSQKDISVSTGLNSGITIPTVMDAPIGCGNVNNRFELTGSPNEISRKSQVTPTNNGNYTGIVEYNGVGNVPGLYNNDDYYIRGHGNVQNPNYHYNTAFLHQMTGNDNRARTFNHHHGGYTSLGASGGNVSSAV